MVQYNQGDKKEYNQGGFPPRGHYAMATTSGMKDNQGNNQGDNKGTIRVQQGYNKGTTRVQRVGSSTR